MFNTNHRHMYTTDKQSDKYREQLGKWMRNYSIENFGEDWDYCIGLSYRYPVVSKRKSYSNMKNFYSKLKKVDKNIQGFVVTEVDKSMVSLHHHLIVKSKLDFDIFKRNTMFLIVKMFVISQLISCHWVRFLLCTPAPRASLPVDNMVLVIRCLDY